MATARKIHIPPDIDVNCKTIPSISEEAAQTATELLQENHERHHIFYNNKGHHNHIVHHILTLLVLGATPAQLKRHYNNNAGYQKDQSTTDAKIDDLSEPAAFHQALGKPNSYKSFLEHFTREIEGEGWHKTIGKYLLDGSTRANDLHSRLLAGFLHPFIHVGFGIEFQQPAIIAEGLAQAAVHEAYLTPLMVGADEKAKANKAANGKPDNEASRGIYEILEDIRADQVLVGAPRYEDGNKLRDGVVGRALERMIEHAATYTVRPDELDERIIELRDFDVYITMAAQRPPKAPKIDFVNMHCANASIFLESMVMHHETSSYLTKEQKCNLLEWRVRNDLAMYVARGCPVLDTRNITAYVSKSQRTRELLDISRAEGKDPQPTDGWDNVLDRAVAYEDDGHAIKLIRALLQGEHSCRDHEAPGLESAVFPNGHSCKRYEEKAGSIGWSTMAVMAMDSVEESNDANGDPEYVRNTGFEQAWEEISARPEAWNMDLLRA